MYRKMWDHLAPGCWSPGRGGTCFCHEVNESSPCPGDHVASPISSDAGTSQRGITAHNFVLGSQQTYQPSQDSISSHLNLARGAAALLAAHRARESDDRTVLSAPLTVLHAVRGRQVRPSSPCARRWWRQPIKQRQAPAGKRLRLQPQPSPRCAARASPARRRRRTKTVRAANRRSEPGHVPHSHCTRELSPHQWSLLG